MSRHLLSRGLPVSGVRRHIAWLGLLAAVMLVAAGCFRTEIGIELEEDGSGFVTFLVAVDETAMGFDGFDDFDDFGFEAEESGGLEDFDPDSLPPGATVEPYEQDGLVGSLVRVPFQIGEDDVARTLDQLFSGVEADEFAGEDDIFDTFRLERDGDLWRFEADATFGDDDIDDFELSFMRSMFPDDPFIVRVKLPGEVVEHNAHDVEGDGTLVWSLDIFSSGTHELRAASAVGTDLPADAVGGADAGDDAAEADDGVTEVAAEPGDEPAETGDPVVADAAADDGGLSTGLIIAIVAAAAIVIGAGAFFLRRGRGASA